MKRISRVSLTLAAHKRDDRTAEKVSRELLIVFCRVAHQRPTIENNDLDMQAPADGLIGRKAEHGWSLCVNKTSGMKRAWLDKRSLYLHSCESQSRCSLREHASLGWKRRHACLANPPPLPPGAIQACLLRWSWHAAVRCKHTIHPRRTPVHHPPSTAP